MARRNWSKPKHYLDELVHRPPRRRPGRGGAAMPEPVEPDPRKPKSGGAEAPPDAGD